MPNDLEYRCPKCDNTEYELSGFRASGGALSAIFDVQNKQFTTVICTRCTYTEIYAVDDPSGLQRVFDLFTT